MTRGVTAGRERVTKVTPKIGSRGHLSPKKALSLFKWKKLRVTTR